ncbi:hypothetical protein DK847_02945 [Aestuariivirga litoralis]|uniref:Right handed beta helix domain-containing protein n=1 Tax=Aestuariivirga litoralis TaxID=2650924 RepID=A0A2W2B1L2_9HYPH|nr:hypothetical protein DK847_02945 [Aestuariivirga litoralis]
MLFASASLALSAVPGSALTTTTTNITCSSTVKLQATIDAVVAGTVATINVSGTCNENIVVPQGKTIVIVGATATSKITPANVLLPAVNALGDVTLRKMVLNNATGAADTLVETNKGGMLTVISSDLSAPNVEAVVGVWGGTAKVTNSRVVGGYGSGLDVWGSSTLVVEGDPAFPAGPTGAFEAYVKSPGAGISCGQGASLRVQAKASGPTNGFMTVEQSRYGIGGNLCDFKIWNKTTSRLNLRIRNITDTGISFSQSRGTVENAVIIYGANGVWLNQSDVIFARTTINGNNIGLNAEQSRVMFDTVTLSNTSGDVQAGTGSSLHFVDWNGVSTLPKMLNWTNSFDCWNGGRIDIESSALSAPLGSKYDFLGCVFVH